MRRIASLLLCLLLLTCSKKDTSRVSMASDDSSLSQDQMGQVFSPDSIVGKVIADLNDDGRPDTIATLRPKKWNDPGDFHFVRFCLGAGQTFAFADTGGWDLLAAGSDLDSSELQSARSISLVPSDQLLIFKGGEHRAIVLAFGVQYASSPGLLAAFEVGPTAVRQIFNREFALSSIADINHDGFPDLIGKDFYGEVAGSCYETYNPYSILLLPGMVRAPESTIREYNLVNYFGYVDSAAIDSFVVVHLSGQKPFVMKESEARAKFDK